MTRRPSGGGRQRLFTQQQELAVVDLVKADNAIRLHQLRKKILADRQVFNNINHVSITTIRRILGKHSITMKQLYRVPFERNSDRVKGLRAEYVRRILAMDGAAQPHGFIFIDEAGFNLCKTRRRGLVQNRPDQPRFVVIWDNVSFQRAALVQAWFSNHNQFEVVYLPPYSPFLNPQPHAPMPLLQAMEQACGDIQVTAIHGWFRHARGYFPRCPAGEDIACDVDEVLWPDPNRRRDP
ncbi:uncharacterized protein LOC128535778 [Clarias gariepinus]|uniref:uncharacterized protein LOC128535778 n=1 Tax=Clarias gariepinus TaxID=13013 RepID=UPI00234D2FE3|nr:uncharacterized protein LOC128535778 [Clarias gariepinus]